jgi:16S rRNA (guanine527-N7)-methyltransferase
MLWLPRALELSRARGFLGPAPVSEQIAHAEGFGASWDDEREDDPGQILDLGSGGGLPGLVLLARWGSPTVLLDSMLRRTDFLREVLAWQDAPAGGMVITERAETAARRQDLCGAFDLVTARSFGPPAVTAECACRFLKVGGLVVVSEPPRESDDNRWSVQSLATLGLVALGRRRHGAAFQVLEKVAATPEQFPRAVGVPGKHPLF